MGGLGHSLRVLGRREPEGSPCRREKYGNGAVVSPPADGGNSATLQFKPDEMSDADGSYSLYLTYKSTSQKDATHIDSGESASLTKQPTVGSAKLVSNTLTISGKWLDQLADASLAPVGTENATKGSDFAVKSKSEATRHLPNVS
jgi:hypothetical protein